MKRAAGAGVTRGAISAREYQADGGRCAGRAVAGGGDVWCVWRAGEDGAWGWGTCSRAANREGAAARCWSAPSKYRLQWICGGREQGGPLRGMLGRSVQTTSRREVLDLHKCGLVVTRAPGRAARAGMTAGERSCSRCQISAAGDWELT